MVFALLLVGIGAYTVFRPSPGDFIAPDRASRGGLPRPYASRGAWGAWPSAWLLTSGESQGFGVAMLLVGIGIGWAVLSSRNR